MRTWLRNRLGPIKRRWTRRLAALNPFAQQREIDALYRLLYQLAHDRREAPDLVAGQTESAFARQWEHLESGQYLLSDPWFRENVDRILIEQELQLRREWFADKEVLDGGCGNGRWSYGLAKLGARVTAVDVNPVAIEKTRAVLSEFGGAHEFVVSTLEDLAEHLPAERTFDLVFSWGVAHHARRFDDALDELTRRVRPGGVLYLYLYGRESLSPEEDLALFKERVRYNTLPDDAARYRFLLRKARGDDGQVHNMHDVYAPLVNRRLEFDDVRRFLEERGFGDVTRTLKHSELFVRAWRGAADDDASQWILPSPQPPYWFEHHAA